MNRKIILQGILLLLAFLPLCGQAKVYMIVTATNEQLTVLQLAERPVLKFADYEMMVRTADAEYTFDRRDIATVTFTDTMPDLPPIPTEITHLSSPDSQHPSTIFWQQTGDAITFHSLEPYAPVTAYTIDGQLVASARADAYGNASISTSYMPKRMLVVRAGSVAVKVTLGESRYEGKSRCEVRGARYEKSEEGGDNSHSGVISYLAHRTSNLEKNADSLYVNKGPTFHVYDVDSIECILFQQDGNQDSLWVTTTRATHAFPWERIDSLTLSRPDFSPYTAAPTIYAEEKFYTEFGSFTVDTPKGLPWVIDFSSAKATGYVGGNTTPSESYLISQPMDMSRAKQVEMSFEYILRYARSGTANRVLITDYFTGEAATTEWTDITGSLTEGKDWATFYDWTRNIPERFLGESAVVVALYYSCGSSSATWEVRNLRIREIYEEIVVATNLNRNPTLDAPEAWRLEYPHISDDTDNNLVIVKRTEDYGITYSLEWDCTKKSQRWTCYEFHDGIPDNGVGRNSDWYDDPDIPKAYQTHYADFTGSGYSRGHMCMSNDRQSSEEQNKQTFYMSNAHPQYQGHNGGLWQTLENTVNRWGNNSSFRDTLYVVKAGTIDNDDDILGYTNSTKTSAHLLVPKYFYMAVLCYKAGQYHAIAFWTEHTSQSITKAKPKDYAITVDELEERTGIDFFCNLPDDIEEEVEQELDLKFWGIQ